MKVLVIGGSGLMGAATIRQLTTAGHTVTNLSRCGTLTSGGLPRPSLPEGIRCLMCDRATDGTKLQVHPHTGSLDLSQRTRLLLVQPPPQLDLLVRPLLSRRVARAL